MKIKKSIIPKKQVFYNFESKAIFDWDISSKYSLDFSAIASFVALGFMLDDDTFYDKIKVLKPGYSYELENNIISKETNYWNWHYNPNYEITLNEIIEKFRYIFEEEILNNINDKSILLPISGGLDSRTLFVPVSKNKQLTLSSYEFENGYPESYVAKQLSNEFKIPLYVNKIQPSYLWGSLKNFYSYNNFFTDFLHPRQVYVMDRWKDLGETILLGHWGDVLFDTHAPHRNISNNSQLNILQSNLLKPAGIELACDLWDYWGVNGNFKEYIKERLFNLYDNIDIDHPSAKMRAFKSLYWAPRWTSINLSIFNNLGDIILPYYSNEMCKFICAIPEKYLHNRLIQIEYMKKFCPKLAAIPWQKYYPLNLYDYKKFNRLDYFIIRVLRKVGRILGNELFQSKKLVTRNWEIQFFGKKNYDYIINILLNSRSSNKFISKIIIKKYIDKFQIDPVKYSHSLSMLLTLSMFSEEYYK